MKQITTEHQNSNREKSDTKFVFSLKLTTALLKIVKNVMCKNFDVTIDKQLFSCKTRCPFIQYLPNKPDKLGIKFCGFLFKISYVICSIYQNT